MRFGGILQLTGNSIQLVLWPRNVHHICTNEIVLDTRPTQSRTIGHWGINQEQIF